MASTPKPLRSGELARLAHVSPDTVRHYEKLGILPCSPRTEAGYRMYPAHAVDRVHLVQRALQLGFSLAELSEIFQTRDSGGAPCRRVLRLAEQKLTALNDQIYAAPQNGTLPPPIGPRLALAIIPHVSRQESASTANSRRQTGAARTNSWQSEKET